MKRLIHILVLIQLTSCRNPEEIKQEIEVKTAIEEPRTGFGPIPHEEIKITVEENENATNQIEKQESDR